MAKLLPGFRDFYPEDCAKRDYLFRIWRERALAHDFTPYDIPTLEELELFTAKSGDEIVGQLFNFVDKGGREVALRPELTPSVARMIGSKANSLKRPVKWFNIAENFRYERQQKSRLRSHYQLNGDIYGEAGVGADLEVMVLALECLARCGLKAGDIVLRLSDRQLWMLYLKAQGYDAAQSMGILGVVDKIERIREPQVRIEKLAEQVGERAADLLEAIGELTALRELDALSEWLLRRAVDAQSRADLAERLADMRALLEGIQAYGLGDYVRIDFGIVRGLAYYTGFVWEIFEMEAGAVSGRALAGGGRYDDLIGKLGYPPMEAVGFGMGDVALLNVLERRKLLPQLVEKPDIYCVFGGEVERRAALRDIANLRRAGYRVRYALKALDFKKQFKQAGESGALVCLIYGGDEVAAGRVTVRDLSSGGQIEVPRAQVAEMVETVLTEGLKK